MKVVKEYSWFMERYRVLADTSLLASLHRGTHTHTRTHTHTHTPPPPPVTLPIKGVGQDPGSSLGPVS